MRPEVEKILAEAEEIKNNLIAQGWTQADFARELSRMLGQETPEAEMPWCEACQSYHVTPKTADHHALLKCRKPLP